MNLRLLQLGDSALPIGGYSQSWGLEAAVERGVVCDPVSLEAWTRAWLRHSVAPAEGVMVASVGRALANAAWERVRQANERVAVSLAPVTLRNASREMGEQLLSLAEGWDWARAVVEQACSQVGECHHAVAFGVLAAAAAAEPIDALAVYLHQAALGVIAAGVKAVPVGHTHGQQILARLHEEISAIASEFAETDMETAGSFCPAHEMLCHAQSRLYTRLFRS